MKDHRFINALLKKPVDKTPIWIMRQAGRYLPEYRKVREQAGDFMTLCSTPELACEVTLQPLQRFDLDAAILFSDILTIPDAMGLGLYFVEGEGPKFKSPIKTNSDIRKLGVPDPENDLAYVMDAVRLIRQELNNSTPLIGFSGSPWTLATYMIEGGSSKTFEKIKKMIVEEPASLHLLLSKLALSVIEYLKAQIKAGAQTVMIFDTWGGTLSTDQYLEYSLNYMQQIIENINTDTKVPVIVFTKGGGEWLKQIANTGCDAIGLDWTVNINEAKKIVGSKVSLQGNLNPEILKETPEVIREETEKILADFGHGSGHIFNLGHGITPDVNPDMVKVLVDSVHELSVPYHK